MLQHMTAAATQTRPGMHCLRRLATIQSQFGLSCMPRHLAARWKPFCVPTWTGPPFALQALPGTNHSMSGTHTLHMLHQLSMTTGIDSLNIISLLTGTPPIEHHCTGTPPMTKVATGYLAMSMMTQITETTMVADQLSLHIIPICMRMPAGTLPDTQIHTMMDMHLGNPCQMTGGMIEISNSCQPGVVPEQQGLKGVRRISAGAPPTQRAGMTGSMTSCLPGTSRGIRHPGWLMSMQHPLPDLTGTACIPLPGMTGTLLA